MMERLPLEKQTKEVRRRAERERNEAKGTVRMIGGIEEPIRNNTRAFTWRPELLRDSRHQIFYDPFGDNVGMNFPARKFITRGGNKYFQNVNGIKVPITLEPIEAERFSLLRGVRVEHILNKAFYSDGKRYIIKEDKEGERIYRFTKKRQIQKPTKIILVKYLWEEFQDENGYTESIRNEEYENLQKDIWNKFPKLSTRLRSKILGQQNEKCAVCHSQLREPIHYIYVGFLFSNRDKIPIRALCSSCNKKRIIPAS